jgi:V-type H+-transporting ATPase subunit B
LLRIFPKELLNRISPKIIDEYYVRAGGKRDQRQKAPEEETANLIDA